MKRQHNLIFAGRYKLSELLGKGSFGEVLHQNVFLYEKE